jgi:hypothetical protein
VRIARKVRVSGIWLNSRPVVFEGAPGFYRAASTRPLQDITRFGQLRKLGLGLDHLAIAAPAERRTETRYGVRDMVVSSLGDDYFDQYRTRVAAVTSATVREAGQRYYGTRASVVVVVGPARTLRPALAGLGPDDSGPRDE